MPGEPALKFRGRRTWSEKATYSALDVVMLDGASFFALYDDPGPCPGEGWQLMARQGKAGSPGIRGERGPAGPGAESLTVSEDGVLTLSLDNGSIITCDLYPLLAKLR